MKHIGITGADGFVGSHLRFFLYEHRDAYEPLSIEKGDFEDATKLSEKLKVCDVIVHLAGMNRGDDEEIYKTNTDLTAKILSTCDEMGKTPHIIFLSSTHNTRETGYGRSKRDCEKMIADWGEKNNTPTTSVVAPNIFGEFVKPYYNSAIATFCHELAEKKDSTVNESAVVELVHVRDMCALIFNLITEESHQHTIRYQGREIKLIDAYNLLKRFRDEYFAGIIPSYADRFGLSLFNTFRSYLYPQYFPVSLDLKTDNRGSFIEVARERSGGQTSFSTTHPGIVRGNHYHTRKIERFCVISGKASIKLRKLFSNEIIEYRVSGDKPVYVDMPTFYTHSIENTGSDELLTLFWINEIFDPKDPDTFAEPVVETHIV